MNIKDKFTTLTEWTFPYGTEHWLEEYLPTGTKRDKHGNYFLEIGESSTLFTCHLDTACKDHNKVTHILEGNFIKSDGTTILGADDKAGMCVILYMIENKIPGTYYFFIGEEVGCIGSRKSAREEEFTKFDRCISFDRRGYNSVITHQMWSRCCSSEFSEALCKELNKSGLKYIPDNTGIVTDSASFMGIIPECTNLSVGYFNEHTLNEKQDIEFLKKLCESVIKVDWESLPTNEFEDDDFFQEEEEDIMGSEWLSDKMEVHIGNDVYLAKLKMDRIIKERSWIYEWVFKTGSYHNLQSVDWDGKTCYINYQGCREHLGERADLIYIIDELSEIPIKDLVLLQKV